MTIYTNSCSHHKVVVQFSVKEFFSDHLVVFCENTDKSDAIKKDILFLALHNLIAN
jgi:hypothetical protein